METSENDKKNPANIQFTGLSICLRISWRKNRSVLLRQYIGGKVVDASFNAFKRFAIALVVILHKQVFHSRYVFCS